MEFLNKYQISMLCVFSLIDIETLFYCCRHRDICLFSIAEMFARSKYPRKESKTRDMALSWCLGRHSTVSGMYAAAGPGLVSHMQHCRECLTGTCLQTACRTRPQAIPADRRSTLTFFMFQSNLHLPRSTFLLASNPTSCWVLLKIQCENKENGLENWYILFICL